MFAHLTQVMNAVEKAAGRVYKSEPSKPESRMESMTSIFALHPTIPNRVDRRPYTVDRPKNPNFSPEWEGGSRTETNPKGLTYAMSTRYKVSRQNKPNRAILHAINEMREKSGRFSTKINA